MTAYALHKASDGRISMSAAYRLMRARGRVQFFDADLLDALCDALAVAPGDLFERGDGAAQGRSAAAKRATRKTGAKVAAKTAAKVAAKTARGASARPGRPKRGAAA